MPKKYQDRAMQVTRNDIGVGESVFFFPKHNPPAAVTATSIEEAEAKLAVLDNKQ